MTGDTIGAGTLLRFGLLGAAVLAWKGGSHLWEAGDTVVEPVSMGLMLLTWVAAFATLATACAQTPPRWTRWLVPLVLLLVFVDYAQVHAVHQLRNGVLVTTDLRLYQDYAARLVLSGENPYTHDLRPAFEVHGGTLEYATPLLNGDYSGRLAYPALSPLLLIPFQLLGVDTAVVYPLFFVLAMAAVYFASPVVWRPVVLLPWFAEDRFVLHAFGGVSDIVWAMLLVLVEARWHRKSEAAVWFGLACSFKQAPWLLGPLLVLRIWHETEGDARARLVAAARFTAISLVPFVLLNAPFVFSDPAAWYAGVTEPVSTPMITLGQGLSALTMTGVAPIPHAAFSVLSLAALAVGTWAYHRHHDRLPELLWLVPGVALWFGHRSLTSYWYFYAIPLVVGLVRRRPTTPRAARSALPTLAAVGGFVAAAAAYVVTHVGAAPQLLVTPVYPLWARGELVERMDFDVVNLTDAPIRPRFAVHTRTNQPFFWTIRTGPLVLESGMSARYAVTTDVPYEMYSIRHGARVTVSDAADYDQRTTLRIAPDESYTVPGRLPNGDFSYWSGDAPTFWGVAIRPRDAGALYLASDGPEAATWLTLRLHGTSATGVTSSVKLDTYTILPDSPVEISVWTPPEVNVAPRFGALFGVELRVGRQTAQILFGDEPQRGTFSNGTPYLVIPVQRQRFTTISLDLEELLTELGIDLTPIRDDARSFAALDFPVVGLNFTPFLSARAEAGPIEARIGHVRSSPPRRDPDARFAHTLHHPDGWLSWLGQFHLAERNFAEARDAFAASVRIAPEVGASWFGLAEAELWLGEWEAASEHYGRSTELGYEIGRSLKGNAWATYHAGRHDEALSRFEEAATHFSEDRPDQRVHAADCHKGRWMALARLGRCDEARAAFADAQSLDPIVSWRDGGELGCTLVGQSDVAHEFPL